MLSERNLAGKICKNGFFFYMKEVIASVSIWYTVAAVATLFNKSLDSEALPIEGRPMQLCRDSTKTDSFFT
jgi:hypothetical protein